MKNMPLTTKGKFLSNNTSPADTLRVNFAQLPANEKFSLASQSGPFSPNSAYAQSKFRQSNYTAATNLSVSVSKQSIKNVKQNLKSLVEDMI